MICFFSDGSVYAYYRNANVSVLGVSGDAGNGLISCIIPYKDPPMSRPLFAFLISKSGQPRVNPRCMHACMYACMHVLWHVLAFFNLNWFIKALSYSTACDGRITALSALTTATQTSLCSASLGSMRAAGCTLTPPVMDQLKGALQLLSNRSK